MEGEDSLAWFAKLIWAAIISPLTGLPGWEEEVGKWG
jgi:hypothetical protein